MSSRKRASASAQRASTNRGANPDAARDVRVTEQPVPSLGWPPWWMPIALVVAVLASFAPLFSAQFVSWDDPQNLVENARWRSLSPDNLQWMFTTPHMGHYHPITWLTFAIDASFGNAQPQGLHVTSVVLHALSALAFFLLARRLVFSALPAWSASARDFTALLAAAFFALHPLRCESVAWLTERRDVLSGLFLVLAVLAWCRFITGGRRRSDFVWTVCAYVLAWGSKGTALVLPIVLCILDVWPLRRWTSATAWRLVREKLVLFALMAPMAAVTMWAAGPAGPTLRGLEQYGLGVRLTQAAYSFVFLPCKTLAPIGLRPIYPLPEAAPGAPALDWTEPRFLAALAAFAAISACVLLWRKRAPALATAWSTYLVFLAPVSGLFQAGPQLVAERYSYSAMQPFALLGAAGCVALAMCRQTATRVAGWLLSIGIVAALAVATRAQCAIWHDSAALWRHTLAVDPDNPHALLHAGLLRYAAAQEAGRPEERRAALDEALALFRRGSSHSRLPLLRINEALAVALQAELDPSKERELLERALALVDEAFQLVRSPTEIEPVWHWHRAGYLFRLGRPAEALPEMETFVALCPFHAQGQRTLAYVCAELKLDERREKALRRASELDPRDALSRVQLAMLLEARGQREAARRLCDEARGLTATGAPLPSAEMRWLQEHKP